MKLVRVILLGLVMTVSAWAGEQSYTGVSAQADGLAAWRFSLVLRDNGGATLRTVKSSFSNTIENAVWTKTESGDISVQFVRTNGRPRGEPLVMKNADGRLTPLTWDKANWGDATPPSLKRG
ncbi:hypothetical protein [Oleiharenicola lentus]|uniref:hypothetical protein n=1 Tax=Oleiharenicola lentus TaxID=2508720 RepID=UPI003F67072B